MPELTITADSLPVIELVLAASTMVQIVMLILFAASFASWWIISRKWTMLRRAMRGAGDFEERFWSGADLAKIHQGLQQSGALTGIERIFDAGFTEFARLGRERRRLETIVAGVQRAMRLALTRETDRLELHLNFLATVGSTSPYVGLFGTVWGIMTSFHALGSAHQATIAMVAPGISEALIATAMGLVAAIPAVIAYNRFSNQVERLEVRYDNFKEEFIALLERQLHGAGNA